MASKRNSRRKQLDGATMSDVFLDIGPFQSESVITRALSHRGEASDSVRSSLNASIDNNVRVEGFRHPSRANAGQLKDSVLYHLIAKSNDKLAGALLRAWVESQPELRDVVRRGLNTVDAPSSETPDFKVGRFNDKWEPSEWQNAKQAVMVMSAAADGDFEEDDAALMMMCVSDKSHQIVDEPGVIESELFSGWLEQLGELPPDAPEWDETRSFTDAVSEMAERKSEDRHQCEVAAIDETMAAIRGEYGEELGYLEIDLSEWTGENAMKKNAASDAKKLAEELRERLAEYRPLRPQGASRAEEAERGPKRDESEKSIIDLVPRWGGLQGAARDAQENGAAALRSPSSAAQPVLPEPGSQMFAEMTRIRQMKTEINYMRRATDELSSDESKEEIKNILQSQSEMNARIERLESDNSQLKGSNSDLQSLNDAISEENARLKRSNAELAAAQPAAAESERDRSALEAEVGRLAEDNRRLSQDNEGLRFDKDLLAEENGGLKSDLARSGENEEYWRNAYIDASAGQTRAGMGLSANEDPASVNEALEIAQHMFANELAIVLNSKSSKNSPFRKPDEVLAALSWLATEYHNLRSNPIESRSDFNKLLKESCPGWFYKPGQTEVTTEQFSEWYTTKINNRTFKLHHHIGKGNSHDPQNTIRIAFAWDDESRRVAVGFLGLHQRNRRS